MGRGKNLNSDAAAFAGELEAEPDESPENKVENGIGPADDKEIEPEISNEDGNPDATLADKKESPDDTPLAAQPKSAAKKTRLVLVGAATYTDAARGGLGMIGKNVPFETDESTAQKLLATGLFLKEQ
jgi:hypothetical protein